jgi:NitT/TauT family transport system ATP-binding protein
MARIEARGIGKVYNSARGNVEALRAVDLDIREGEFVTLLGPSGCGKSTLLRIAAGLQSPSRGRLDIVGERSRTPKPAMVFQDYGIFPWKTVLKNVMFGLVVAGTGRQEAKSRALNVLERLELEDFAGQYPSELSGGMKQRVSIARALVMEPDVLLMDEPFAALDAQLRMMMQEELLNLWEADRRTVLFVTHDLDEAILLSDRVVVMSQRPGKIIADVDITFPRPRAASLRGSAEFATLRQDLWSKLKREVDIGGRALGAEHASD